MLIKGEETLRAEKDESVQELLRANAIVKGLKSQLDIAAVDLKVCEVRTFHFCFVRYIIF